MIVFTFNLDNKKEGDQKETEEKKGKEDGVERDQGRKNVVTRNCYVSRLELRLASPPPFSIRSSFSKEIVFSHVNNLILIVNCSITKTKKN